MNENQQYEGHALDENVGVESPTEQVEPQVDDATQDPNELDESNQEHGDADQSVEEPELEEFRNALSGETDPDQMQAIFNKQIQKVKGKAADENRERDKAYKEIIEGLNKQIETMQQYQQQGQYQDPSQVYSQQQPVDYQQNFDGQGSQQNYSPADIERTVQAEVKNRLDAERKASEDKQWRMKLEDSVAKHSDWGEVIGDPTLHRERDHLAYASRYGGINPEDLYNLTKSRKQDIKELSLSNMSPDEATGALKVLVKDMKRNAVKRKVVSHAPDPISTKGSTVIKKSSEPETVDDFLFARYGIRR